MSENTDSEPSTSDSTSYTLPDVTSTVTPTYQSSASINYDNTRMQHSTIIIYFKNLF